MSDTQAAVLADSAGHTMIDPEPLPEHANLNCPVREERQEGRQSKPAED